MKMPWGDRTGLAKAAAVLASVLTVSLGLCGVNFWAVMQFASPFSNRRVQWPGKLLSFTAWIELIAIAVSIMGLLTVGLAALVRSIRESPPSISDREQDREKK